MRKNEQYQIIGAKEVEKIVQGDNVEQKISKLPFYFQSNTNSALEKLINYAPELDGATIRGVRKTNYPFSNQAKNILDEITAFDSRRIRNTELNDGRIVVTGGVLNPKPHTQYTLGVDEFKNLYQKFFGYSPAIQENWTAVPLHMIAWQIEGTGKDFSWEDFSALESAKKKEVARHWGNLVMESRKFMEFIIKEKEWSETAEVFTQAAVANVNKTFNNKAFDWKEEAYRVDGWERSAATVRSAHAHIGIRTKSDVEKGIEDEELFFINASKAALPALEARDAHTSFPEVAQEKTDMIVDHFTANVARNLEKLYLREVDKVVKMYHLAPKAVEFVRTFDSNTVDIFLPHVRLLFDSTPDFADISRAASDLFVAINKHWQFLLKGLLHYFHTGRTDSLNYFINTGDYSENPEMLLDALLLAHPPKGIKTRGVVVKNTIVEFNKNTAYTPAGNAGFTLHLLSRPQGDIEVDVVPSLTNRGPAEAKRIALFDKK